MPEVTITLPTLHSDQVKAYQQRTRFYAIRCGRRWGKTKYGIMIAADGALKGRMVGWFAPDYKRMSEVFPELKHILNPLTERASGVSKEIRLATQGGIDFWTLDDSNAGRGRFYHQVIIDEAAFTDNKTMMGTWEKSIKPTLLDYSGSALVLSNTNGDDVENFFWLICNKAELGFTQYHAPTTSNPLIPKRIPGEAEESYLARREAEFAKLRSEYPPLVYQQEFEAEFVDWSGAAFFMLAKLLDEAGKPIAYPQTCDAVYAIINSATKTGKENDGTAVVYFARSREAISRTPLVILDYDIAQIEGALLENWLPQVFEKLEGFAQTCKARAGSLGVWIEDKASGTILLQQAMRRRWKAHAINSKLTALGKSERAIDISGYVFQGKVKLSAFAHDKVVPYKGVARNHLTAQVLGFRPGSKDQIDDDLLDGFTYGVALAYDDAAAMRK